MRKGTGAARGSGPARDGVAGWRAGGGRREYVRGGVRAGASRSVRPGSGAAGRGLGLRGRRLHHKSLRVPPSLSPALPPPPPPSPPLPAPPPAAARQPERAERAEQGRGRAPAYADERVTDSFAFQCPSETRALLPQLLTPDSRLPQTPTAGLARGCAHRLRAAAAAPPPRRSPGPRASRASAPAGLPRPGSPAPAAAPRPGRAWMEGAARLARCSA